MQILFLHGWHSLPDGVKPTFLAQHGHEVTNPALPDEDFEAAVRIAQAEFDKHRPDVVVGSSRGGAVAMNINSGDARLVLMCPAWKKWGSAKSVKPGTVILHSRADDVVPFAQSEKLVRNSGLQPSALVAVGHDHWLADPESLVTMLESVNLCLPILCLGIDVAWWGGSRRKRDSQRDTVVWGTLRLGQFSDLSFRMVDLSLAPNPNGKLPTEPNLDRDGKLLAQAVADIVAAYAGRVSRTIVSLDTPVEMRKRPKQPPRIKSAKKKQKTGAERRQCERELEAYKKALPAKVARKGWNDDLRIQSGSPVSPRMRTLLKILVKQNGFVFWRKAGTAHGRQLIEVFPSEAIWFLGIRGSYANATSSEVRRFKKPNPSRIPMRAARKQAMTTLTGFKEVFKSRLSGNIPIQRWIEQIVDYACEITSLQNDGFVKKGKGFDDPIESGISFLTSVAFAIGNYHAWGDGSDGTIVGPGRLS